MNWKCSDCEWKKQGLAKLRFTKPTLLNIDSTKHQALIHHGNDTDSRNFLELIDLIIANDIYVMELWLTWASAK
jgi:hypothetical protein